MAWIQEPWFVMLKNLLFVSFVCTWTRKAHCRNSWTIYISTKSLCFFRLLLRLLAWSVAWRFKMPRKTLPTWRRYLTVEPVIFFYAYGLMTSMPIWRQYVYSVISDMKGFPYDELVMGKDEPGCKEHFSGSNSTLRDLEREVIRFNWLLEYFNLFIINYFFVSCCVYWDLYEIVSKPPSLFLE